MFWFFFVKQKTAYERRSSDWSSDVCSSDLDDGKRRGKLSPEDPRVTVTLHQGDLPDGLDLGPVVAIDTETMGLRPIRDRLCLVQLSAGDGSAHLVQFAPGKYDAPNLARLLTDPETLQLFHFARFDVAVLQALDRKSTRLNSSHSCAYR